MNDYKNININDYDYHLPNEYIAQFPLKERDRSKLLIYYENKIQKDIFLNIDKYIPKNSFLIFNNTRVIKARLYFTKLTGARIEVFCLEPENGMDFLINALNSTDNTTWKCLVGKSGKWKHTPLIAKATANNIEYELQARITDKTDEYFVIKFNWTPPQIKFYEILKIFGITPLPPYIKRKSNSTDEITYQTIYAQKNGSVAAPTSGFHFTDEVFSRLRIKDIEFLYLTLHIGIATFKPVKSEIIGKHKMHSEYISFNYEFIEKLYNNAINFKTNKYKQIISVGTTSTRALESLYWLGVKMNSLRKKKTEILSSFKINQWEPYELKNNLTQAESLKLILQEMKENNIKQISGNTELIIVPGYEYKLVNGLITNFHMPKSTLLLLVSAFIGNKWKEIYQYAIENNFRFLSYGDACLFLPK